MNQEPEAPEPTKQTNDVEGWRWPTWRPPHFSVPATKAREADRAGSYSHLLLLVDWAHPNK